MTKLVIVESPTKVKSLSKYLPSDCKVDSCVGHIRDLPASKSQIPKAIKDEEWGDVAVDWTKDFQPHYVTIRGKAKTIKELKAKLKNVDELYLATDEDREGESISWHLIEALKPDVPVKRMVFNEITKEAIVHALENPRELDMNLVQAQETRRVLDRLYGYTLSPLLWKKIGGNLSAGRVQSVATRLIVIRERERRAFVSGSYWDLKATLDKDATPFEAKLRTVDGKRIAEGGDFDKDTGRIQEGKDVLLLEEDRARELESRLKGEPWRIASVEATERQSKPFPPFITSTLQQEANNRLNMGARDTMRVAQSLYEQGLITYMRTDSTHLSEEGLTGARKAVASEFGDQYIPAGPRTYGSKKTKGAQEAHEAIRPAGATFKHPDEAGVSGREKQLYDLIWRRTLASQMHNERYTSTSVTIEVAECTFVATGRRTDFPGWRLAYPQSTNADTTLPSLTEGDGVDCKELTAEGHETKPPARFTEASLVRELEKLGIGRPSTYADIISTITSRNYVDQRGKALVPTFTAFAVTQLLEKHFPNLVDFEFTASMEEQLDEIAAGEAERIPYLERFFLGEEGLKAQVEKGHETIEPAEAKTIDLQGLPYTVKISRHGPYVESEVDGELVRADVPENATPDDLTEEFVATLIKRRSEGPRVVGQDPETGKDVLAMSGRYGPYVQLGEKEGKKKVPTASLPKEVAPEDVSLEDALFLLKPLGEHPDGGTIEVGLGRFGPYVLHTDGDGKKTYANVPNWATLRALDLEGAVQVIKDKRSRPSKRRGGPEKVKVLGEHDGKEVAVYVGRYGPYVQLGEATSKAKGAKGKKAEKPTRTSLPDGVSPESLGMADALKLLLPLGDHPEGGKVILGVGRRGPYVAHDPGDGGSKTYANVDDWDTLRKITLEDALARLGVS